MKKKLTYLLVFSLFLILSCSREKQTEKEKFLPPTETSTIDEMIEWANNQEWTEEEIAHFDSLNENYALLIRGAERELDTIINHYHFCFTTDE